MRQRLNNFCLRKKIMEERVIVMNENFDKYLIYKKFYMQSWRKGMNRGGGCEICQGTLFIIVE